MVAQVQNPVDRLYRQFKVSGMTYPVLANRSGVPIPTLKRIFADNSAKASLANVLAIAEALGMSMGLNETIDVRMAQARKKARRVVGMVQGTSALESQALDEEQIKQMIERTVHELLAGSNRKLWAP